MKDKRCEEKKHSQKKTYEFYLKKKQKQKLYDKLTK